MLLSILKYFSFLALICVSSKSFAESVKITIEAGQSRVLSIPSGSTVDMNPRKILEIEPSGKGQIRLLALKSGVVTLKASNAESGESQSWLVEVLGRDLQSDWLLRSEWQSYFCAREGIQCDLERKVLSGEARDLRWFYEARAICKKKMPCTWLVTLQDEALNRAERELTPMMSQLSFRLGRDGSLRLDSRCEEGERKTLDRVIANLSDAYGVTPQINCLTTSPEPWALDVLVVADREGLGEISNPLQWERIELPSTKPLRAFIAGLSQTSKMHVVAQPELSLSMGGTAVLRDGQEIQTLAVQKDSAEILWKTSGFRLELKLLEARGDLARIHIHLNLSQPQAGLRTIDASEFVSEVWVPLGILQRVGSMQAQVEGREENNIPWLSSIPLLGALFRWEGNTRGKSQIDIFLRVRPGALSEGLSDTADWIGKE